MEIFNILKGLDVKKGPGVDSIRPLGLKQNASYLTPILIKFINLSVENKTSLIRPIY